MSSDGEETLYTADSRISVLMSVHGPFTFYPPFLGSQKSVNIKEDYQLMPTVPESNIGFNRQHYSPISAYIHQAKNVRHNMKDSTIPKMSRKRLLVGIEMSTETFYGKRVRVHFPLTPDYCMFEPPRHVNFRAQYTVGKLVPIHTKKHGICYVLFVKEGKDNFIFIYMERGFYILAIMITMCVLR